MKTVTTLLLTLGLGVMLASCGDEPAQPEGNATTPATPGIATTTVGIDLSNSSGLVITDGSGVTTAGLHMANAAYLGIEPDAGIFRGISVANGGFNHAQGQGEASLQKIDSDGNVSAVIETESTSVQQVLPRVRSIGISPAGDVYFHFEYNFVYRDQDDDGVTCANPWEQDSPCSCQIFKSVNTVSEMAENIVTPELGNLECLDDQHFIAFWNDVSQVFQFDADSNVYYQGQLPQSNQSVLYRTARQKVDGQFVQEEVINANICVNDYRVTSGGGLFYVGQNCLDGQWGGADGSFFRYVSPDGSLSEIARNWYEFTFEVIEGADNDQVLFYGPDPDSSQVASWDSACLFQFDPSAAAGSRSTKLVECNNNIWEWLELRRTADIAAFGNHQSWQTPPAEWRAEYRDRCLSDSHTFIGGGTGSPVRSILQDAEGQAFIVGNISQKNAGEYKCNLEIKGPHCVINNIPAVANGDGAYTQTSCESDLGTWVADGWCDDPGGAYYPDKASCDADASTGGSDATWTYYPWGTWYDQITYDPNIDLGNGNIQGHICLQDGVARDEFDAFPEWEAFDGSEDTVLHKINNVQCEQPDEGWTTQYKGLAYVNADTGQLELRSELDEQVADMWLVDGSIYYAAYSGGQYQFNQEMAESGNVNLLENFEVYHVAQSPRGGGLIMFDGLNFTNNSYTFGDLDPAAEDVEGSISTTVGLTGQVQTIIIY